MFIEPAIIGLICAWIRKGKIKNIYRINVRAMYLFLLAALIQIFLSLSKALDLKYLSILADNYFLYIYLFSYILLLIGVLLNTNNRFMRYIFIGIILNAIVIFSNGGKMPVSINGIRGINNNVIMTERSLDIKHTGMKTSTKFKYLGDIFLIPKPYPLARVISIGDIFMMIGIVLFFSDNMVNKRSCIYITPYLTKNKR